MTGRQGRGRSGLAARRPGCSDGQPRSWSGPSPALEAQVAHVAWAVATAAPPVMVGSDPTTSCDKGAPSRCRGSCGATVSATGPSSRCIGSCRRVFARARCAAFPLPPGWQLFMICSIPPPYSRAKRKRADAGHGRQVDAGRHAAGVRRTRGFGERGHPHPRAMASELRCPHSSSPSLARPPLAMSCGYENTGFFERCPTGPRRSGEARS